MPFNSSIPICHARRKETCDARTDDRHDVDKHDRREDGEEEAAENDDCARQHERVALRFHRETMDIKGYGYKHSYGTEHKGVEEKQDKELGVGDPHAIVDPSTSKPQMISTGSGGPSSRCIGHTRYNDEPLVV